VLLQAEDKNQPVWSMPRQAGRTMTVHFATEGANDKQSPKQSQGQNGLLTV